MGNAHAPLISAVESRPEELSDYSQGPHWSEKPDAEAVIRYAKKGPASKEMAPAMTVPELLAKAAKKRPSAFALFQEPLAEIQLIDGKKWPPPVPREKWRSWTWAQYYSDVRKAARAMMALGFVQHDACTIFGFVSLDETVVMEVCRRRTNRVRLDP